MSASETDRSERLPQDEVDYRCRAVGAFSTSPDGPSNPDASRASGESVLVGGVPVLVLTFSKAKADSKDFLQNVQ